MNDTEWLCATFIVLFRMKKEIALTAVANVMSAIKILFGIIIVTIALYSCGPRSEKNKDEFLKGDTVIDNRNQDQSAPTPDTTENFLVFLNRFSSAPEFQLSRVKFPMKDCFLDSNGVDLVCNNIFQPGWEHLELVDGSEEMKLIFDNYEHRFRNNDERVFAYQGIENDVAIFYYFKKENGLWYLFKRENLSD